MHCGSDTFKTRFLFYIPVRICLRWCASYAPTSKTRDAMSNEKKKNASRNRIWRPVFKNAFTKNPKLGHNKIGNLEPWEQRWKNSTWLWSLWHWEPITGAYYKYLLRMLLWSNLQLQKLKNIKQVCLKESWRDKGCHADAGKQQESASSICCIPVKNVFMIEALGSTIKKWLFQNLVPFHKDLKIFKQTGEKTQPGPNMKIIFEDLHKLKYHNTGGIRLRNVCR